MSCKKVAELLQRGWVEWFLFNTALTQEFFTMASRMAISPQRRSKCSNKFNSILLNSERGHHASFQNKMCTCSYYNRAINFNV